MPSVLPQQTLFLRTRILTAERRVLVCQPSAVMHDPDFSLLQNASGQSSISESVQDLLMTSNAFLISHLGGKMTVTVPSRPRVGFTIRTFMSLDGSFYVCLFNENNGNESEISQACKAG